eukprot:1827170-Rhodomonas_salina.4
MADSVRRRAALGLGPSREVPARPSQGELLRACYAMSGTGMAHATRLLCRVRYCHSVSCYALAMRCPVLTSHISRGRVGREGDAGGRQEAGQRGGRTKTPICLRACQY